MMNILEVWKGKRVFYKFLCSKMIFQTYYSCSDSHENIVLYLKYYVILKVVNNMVNVNRI